MPITYSFLDGAVWFVAIGEVPCEEASTIIYKALNDSGFRVGMPLIFDLQRCTSSPQAESVRARARFLGEIKDKISPTVILIVSNDFHFGISRMLGTHAEQNGIKVEIFREEEKARQWLSLKSAARRTNAELKPGICLT
jgi:hypothetical protein